METITVLYQSKNVLNTEMSLNTFTKTLILFHILKLLMKRVWEPIRLAKLMKVSKDYLKMPKVS